MKRIALVALAAVLAAPGPALAQTGGPDRFSGNWLIANVPFSSQRTRLVIGFNADTLTKAGDTARIQMARIDESNLDGVRTNLIDVEFNCATARFRYTRVRNFDAAHRFVANAAGVGETPVGMGTPARYGFNYACAGLKTGFLPATTDVQGGALRVFAAHPKRAVPSDGQLAQKAAQWLARTEKECSEDDRFDVDAYALHRKQMKTQIESDRARRDYIVERANWRRMCVENRARALDSTARAAIKPRLDRLQQDSIAYYTVLHNKARAAFEANVSAHTFIGNANYRGDYTLPALRKIFRDFQGFRTLAQTCGTFDYSMPYIDDRYVRPRDQRRKEYGRCIEAYRKRDDGLGLGEVNFSMATTEVLAFAPYVCSRHKVAGCIKDKDWKAFHAVANEKNLAYIRKIDKLRSYERYTRSNEEIDKLNKWLDDLNAAIRAHNARRS